MPMSAGEVVALSARIYWKQIENLRLSEAQKMWYWYMGEKNMIDFYIREAMYKMFKKKTVKKMNVRVFNVVPRVIDKLSLAYKNPPERYLDGGVKYSVDKTTRVTTADQPESDKRYQELLSESNIAKKEGEWLKLGRLFNTILVQPVWKEDPTSPGEFFMDFTIHTPAWTVVIPKDDDFLTPQAFYYPTWRSVNGEVQQVLVWWDAESHYYLDRMGNKVAVPGNPTMENPFHRLPVAVLRLKDAADFWGEGMWDLVEGNEEVCIQATNIFYVSIFQAHGQPVAINMNLSGEPPIGPDIPIVVNDARSDGATPDFKFVNANPNIKAVQDLIDWALKTLQVLKGLGPQQFSTSVKGMQSGVSKIVDASEIEEIRVDDTKILTGFEESLFDVMRMVHNYYNGSKPIPEDAKFSVSFGEQKITKNIQDQIAEREAFLQLGIASRVDFILEDNPGMTREEAQERLEQIISENQQFKTGFDAASFDTPDSQGNQDDGALGPIATKMMKSMKGGKSTQMQASGADSTAAI